MAKKATGTIKSGGSARKRKPAPRKPSKTLAATGTRPSAGADSMGDAFRKLLQSPLVADLLAVAATAALAALAEHGFSNRGDGGGRKPGRAVKEAGKAAAAAIGRRLGTEVDAIRSAAKAAKGAATK